MTEKTVADFENEILTKSSGEAAESDLYDKIKKKSTNVEICKVLFWNKNSRNFAFEYKGKTVQITLPSELTECSETVQIKFKNGTYEIV